MSSKDNQIKQAVLICDDFDGEFCPLTNDFPLALLPLANRTLLEHSLDFLHHGGINHVFIFTSYMRKVREHLTKVDLLNDKITLIPSDSLSSLGDVLREVFTQQLVKSDFVLVNGCALGNLPLRQLLNEHFERRTQTDRGAVMTIVYREKSYKTYEERLFVAFSKPQGKLLHYEHVHAMDKRTIIPLRIFKENPVVNMKHSLVDCGVYICSNAVPALFADNFDYCTRDDFVRGLLVHEEILGNTIYVRCCEENEYVFAIKNPHLLDAVTTDYLQRWAYPFVPERQPGLLQLRHGLYQSSDVHVQMDCDLSEDVIIGSGTLLGAGVKISKSVIGPNCVIGDNVRIHNSHIWNNVRIDVNCVLEKCIVASNAHVKQDCNIPRGCMLNQNVIIGPSAKLKEYTILVAETDFDEPVDKSIVGAEGKAYIYTPEEEEEDDEEEDEEDEDCLLKKKFVMPVWGADVESDEDGGISTDSYSDSEDESTDGLANEGNEDSDEHVDDDVKNFYTEVIDSLQRGLQEKIDCTNLILEINCSKHAYNIPIRELIILVVKSILDLPIRMSKETLDERTYYPKLNQVIKYFLPLFRNYVKSLESQADCLLSIEHFCLCNQTTFSPAILVKAVNFLYGQDILAEQLIIRWFQTPSQFPSLFANADLLKEARAELRKNNSVISFIKWLEEAEEESSEESDN